MRMRIWIGVLLAAVAGVAASQGPPGVLKQAEATLVVTGHVDIQPDGTVSAYEIEGREHLPDFVVSMVDQAAGGWRFEPVLVDGEAVRARAKMNLRFVAKPVEDAEFMVTIASGTFGGYSDTATDWITRRKMEAPRYPSEVLRSGGQGTVYLLLKVGRNGKVEDVVAEQVNLRTYGTERQMERMRQAFAKASLAAARRWVFNPPTTGDRVAEDYWVTRMPVEYSIDSGRRRNEVVAWEGYIPGPRQPRPAWAPERDSGSDAVPSGSLAMVGDERRLLTSLDGT